MNICNKVVHFDRMWTSSDVEVGFNHPLSKNKIGTLVTTWIWRFGTTKTCSILKSVVHSGFVLYGKLTSVEFNTWVISLLIDSSWRSSLCFHTVHLGGDCLESWLLPFFSNSVLTNSSNSNNEAEPQSSRGKARSVTIVLWSLTRRNYRPCWPSLSRPALFWRCHHWFPYVSHSK